MNYWALISFIPSIPHFLLGVYALYKDRKKPLNITFSLFAFSVAIWCFAEFIHRSTNDPQVAYIGIRLSGFGWCFMASLCVHFVLLFARKEKLLRSNLTYIALYVPFFIVLYLFLTTNLIYKQEPVKMFFGYTSVPGKFIWVYTVYYLLMFVPMTYFLLEVTRKGTSLEKKQAMPIFFGSVSFLLLTTSTNIIFPMLRTEIPELGTTFSMIWVISIFYAVLKYKLFTIEPSIEDLANMPKKYSLQEGHIYLVKEDSPDSGYLIFYDQITHGKFGLCVTKFSPEIVRQRHEIVKTPIFWSTFKNIENSISPKDIDGLISLSLDFVNKTRESILFFDCFDQIKFVNGFDRFISMIINLKTLCKNNNFITLVSLNPEMFDKQQFLDIEKEFDEVSI